MATANEPLPQAAEPTANAPDAPAPELLDKQKLAPLWLKAVLLVYYLAIFGGLAFFWNPWIKALFAQTADPLPQLDQILRYTALAAMAGVLGGTLHGLASLEKHVGRGDLLANWWIFYVARPFTGAAMAVCVILLLGSGMLGIKVEAANGGFVVLGWSVLAGLFSTPALAKLRDMFNVVFQPSAQGEAKRSTGPRGSDAKVAGPGADSGPGQPAAMADKISGIIKPADPLVDASKGTGT